MKTLLQLEGEFAELRTDLQELAKRFSKFMDDVSDAITTSATPRAQADMALHRNDPNKVDPGYKCPCCDGPMRQRTSSFGDFYGCLNYPKCKGARSLEGRNTTRGPIQANRPAQPELPVPVLPTSKETAKQLAPDEPMEDVPF